MQPKRPDCKTTVAQNIFINMMTFRDRGDRNLGHLHSYDHLTVLSSGALEVHCDGMVGRFRAPHLFLTPKDRAHQFYALEDHTVVACIHPLRQPEQGTDILPPEIQPAVCGQLINHLTRPGADYNKQSEVLALPVDQSQYFVPEAGNKALVLKAVCDNTTVEIIHLPQCGDREEIKASPATMVHLLGAGSVEVHCQGAVKRYQAPHVFISPRNSEVVFTGLTDHVVIAKLRTLRGEEQQDDQIAQEITLDYAAEALHKILQDINEQTTVVGSFTSPTFAATPEML